MKSKFLVFCLVLVALLSIPLSPLALSDDGVPPQDEARNNAEDAGLPEETAEAPTPDATDAPDEAAMPVAPDESADPDDISADDETDAPGEPLAQGLIVVIDEAVLFPGQHAQASARVSPTNAVQAVEWSSSEPDAVTIDAAGRLVAGSSIEPPEDGLYVDIWARATDGSLMMNCTTVYVLPAATLLKLLPGELTVSASDPVRTAFIAVELAPAALYGVCPIEWSSSNPDIAQASPAGERGEVGLVTWSGTPGTCVITARALDGSNISDVLHVTVTP